MSVKTHRGEGSTRHRGQAYANYFWLLYYLATSSFGQETTTRTTKTTTRTKDKSSAGPRIPPTIIKQCRVLVLDQYQYRCYIVSAESESEAKSHFNAYMHIYKYNYTWMAVPPPRRKLLSSGPPSKWFKTCPKRAVLSHFCAGLRELGIFVSFGMIGWRLGTGAVIQG